MTEGPPWKCKSCGELAVYPAATVSQPCQECGGMIEGKGWACRSCDWRLAHPDLREPHPASEVHKQGLELARKKEAEARRTEIDSRLLAGLDNFDIRTAVKDVTDAQIASRRLELAKLKENRGRKWAELAIDQEILRLTKADVPREVIVRDLKVGSHRIKRVRKEAGLARRSWQGDMNRDRVSRGLPTPIAEDPTPEDDRRRTVPRKSGSGGSW